MKLLLTNDDGWDADGLAILADVARDYGEVWTVAPAEPMSGISHQITFESPLTLSEQSERTFSLTGTPADCVRIGLTQLDVEFDWVLSGINNGSNLGSDIYVSGTFAASREAATRGHRTIALSQYRRKFKQPFDWTHTRQLAKKTLTQLLGEQGKCQPGQVTNVNFPDLHHLELGVPDQIMANASNNGHVKIVHCKLDRSPLPADYLSQADGQLLFCSKYEDRPRMPGHDVAVCYAGNISVSCLDFTGRGGGFQPQ